MKTHASLICSHYVPYMRGDCNARFRIAIARMRSAEQAEEHNYCQNSRADKSHKRAPQLVERPIEPFS